MNRAGKDRLEHSGEGVGGQKGGGLIWIGGAGENGGEQQAAALVEEAIKVIDLMLENPGRRAQRREVRGELIVRGSARVPATGLVTKDNKKVWHP